MCIHMHTDMCIVCSIDMCMDMCIDMDIDMCICMYVDMCIDMYKRGIDTRTWYAAYPIENRLTQKFAMFKYINIALINQVAVGLFLKGSTELTFG